jgi:hypothetical protein
MTNTSSKAAASFEAVEGTAASMLMRSKGTSAEVVETRTARSATGEETDEDAFVLEPRAIAGVAGAAPRRARRGDRRAAGETAAAATPRDDMR